MKKALILLTIIVLAVLALAWPSRLNFFHCKPDLLLVFMVALVFYLDFKTAWIFGVVAGLAKDLFLPWPLATNTICFAVWSYLIFRLSRQISTDEDYVRLGIVLAAALLNNFALGLQSIASGVIIPPGIFLRNLVIVSAYTTLLSPWIFKFTKRIAS